VNLLKVWALKPLYHVNIIRKLSVGKQVVFMFGTLRAILVALGALFFFSFRSIESSSRENLSYVGSN